MARRTSECGGLSLRLVGARCVWGRGMRVGLAPPTRPWRIRGVDMRVCRGWPWVGVCGCALHRINPPLPLAPAAAGAKRQGRRAPAWRERLERLRLHPTGGAYPRRRCLAGSERKVGGTMRDKMSETRPWPPHGIALPSQAHRARETGPVGHCPAEALPCPHRPLSSQYRSKSRTKALRSRLVRASISARGARACTS